VAPDDGDDADRLRRRVLWALPTGLFVVGSRAADERNLMTCNWVMQVATSPKLVAMAVESGSVTRRLVESGGTFAVSMLARSERGLVRRFVKPVRDVALDDTGAATSMQGVPVVEVAGGLPVLADAVAWLACTVRAVHGWDAVGTAAASAGPDPQPAGASSHDGGSHVLVVGEVTAFGASDRLSSGDPDDAVLSMGDTRMSYGG
jgi:flavin reductase (DIM6/NTAB) family NADH-FMN oxidoreductase RutF